MAIFVDDSFERRVAEYAHKFSIKKAAKKHNLRPEKVRELMRRCEVGIERSVAYAAPGWLLGIGVWITAIRSVITRMVSKRMFDQPPSSPLEPTPSCVPPKKKDTNTQNSYPTPKKTKTQAPPPDTDTTLVETNDPPRKTSSKPKKPMVQASAAPGKPVPGDRASIEPSTRSPDEPMARPETMIDRKRPKKRAPRHRQKIQDDGDNQAGPSNTPRGIDLPLHTSQKDQQVSALTLPLRKDTRDKPSSIPSKPQSSTPPRRPPTKADAKAVAWTPTASTTTSTQRKVLRQTASDVLTTHGISIPPEEKAESGPTICPKTCELTHQSVTETDVLPCPPPSPKLPAPAPTKSSISKRSKLERPTPRARQVRFMLKSPRVVLPADDLWPSAAEPLDGGTLDGTGAEVPLGEDTLDGTGVERPGGLVVFGLDRTSESADDGSERIGSDKQNPCPQLPKDGDDTNATHQGHVHSTAKSNNVQVMCPPSGSCTDNEDKSDAWPSLSASSAKKAESAGRRRFSLGSNFGRSKQRVDITLSIGSGPSSPRSANGTALNTRTENTEGHTRGKRASTPVRLCALTSMANDSDRSVAHRKGVRSSDRAHPLPHQTLGSKQNPGQGEPAWCGRPSRFRGKEKTNGVGWHHAHRRVHTSETGSGGVWVWRPVDCSVLLDRGTDAYGEDPYTQLGDCSMEYSSYAPIMDMLVDSTEHYPDLMRDPPHPSIPEVAYPVSDLSWPCWTNQGASIRARVSDAKTTQPEHKEESPETAAEMDQEAMVSAASSVPNLTTGQPCIVRPFSPVLSVQPLLSGCFLVQYYYDPKEFGWVQVALPCVGTS